MVNILKVYVLKVSGNLKCMIVNILKKDGFF